MQNNIALSNKYITQDLKMATKAAWTILLTYFSYPLWLAGVIAGWDTWKAYILFAVGFSFSILKLYDKFIDSRKKHAEFQDFLEERKLKKNLPRNDNKSNSSAA